MALIYLFQLLESAIFIEAWRFAMEETLKSILSELKVLNERHQEIMEGQNGLIGRIESIEKVQKKLVTNTKNINHNHEELIRAQHQNRIRIDHIEEVKNVISLGHNEIRELIKQTTMYMAGKLSLSDRLNMEIDLLNDQEQKGLLNKINEKIFLRNNKNAWNEHWDDNDF